jgi:hypothetical protein
MKTLLLSFYSDIEDRTYYSEHAKTLKEACVIYNIPHDIQEKKSLGTYQDNCLSKPQYILDKLEEHNCPLLWADVDSLVHKSLDVFDTFEDSADVALSTSNGKISGIKASPIYFNCNENSKRFLNTWIGTTRKILEEEGNHFDHEPLFGIVAGYLEVINVGFVGPEYCVWPGHTNENSFITMGLADSENKKDNLRKMGLSEDLIEWQSPGDNYEN